MGLMHSSLNRSLFVTWSNSKHFNSITAAVALYCKVDPTVIHRSILLILTESRDDPDITTIHTLWKALHPDAPPSLFPLFVPMLQRRRGSSDVSVTLG